MARKMSEDALYARELGIADRRDLRRVVRRLGGASKLRALSPEARNLLLSPGRKTKREKV